jgi:hypothetical protein
MPRTAGRRPKRKKCFCSRLWFCSCGLLNSSVAVAVAVAVAVWTLGTLCLNRGGCCWQAASPLPPRPSTPRPVALPPAVGLLHCNSTGKLAPQGPTYHANMQTLAAGWRTTRRKEEGGQTEALESCPLVWGRMCCFKVLDDGVGEKTTISLSPL